jgi:hypothetical protein
MEPADAAPNVVATAAVLPTEYVSVPAAPGMPVCNFVVIAAGAV